MNKYFMVLLVLVCINLVYAATPFQLSNTDMQIEFPKYDVIKQGNEHRFHIHVINETSAKTNKTTSCYLHLYNQTGYDIEQTSGAMEFEDYNGIDFAKTINGSFFSTTGIYSYVVQCNSTNQIAFASGQIEVTASGRVSPSENYLIFLHLLYLFTFIGLLMTLVLNIARLATSTETIFSVLTSWSIYILLIFTDYLGKYYLPDQFITSNTTILLSVFALTHVVIPIISLVITMIYKSFEKKGNLSIEELLGRSILR